MTRPEAAAGTGGVGGRWLLGIVALAAGVRIVAWARTAALFNDGPIFLSLAEAYAEGDASAALRHAYHPLYPLLTAALLPWLGDLETAAVAVSIAGGALAAGALTVLLGDTFDRTAARVGGVLLALHPFAVSVSSDVQSDGLYLGLFLLSLALLWRALACASPGRAAAAGVVIGLAYLTRPEGLGLGLVGAAAAAGLVFAGRWRPGRAVGWAAALAAGALIVATPYAVALQAETGAWSLTQKKSFAGIAGLGEAGPQALPSRLAPPPSLPRASDAPAPPPAGPAARLGRALGELYRAVVPAFRIELLPLLALGWIVCRGRPGMRGLVLGGMVALYGAVLIALALTSGYVSRRHALPPLAPLMGYAAVGLVWLGGRAAGWLRVPAPRRASWIQAATLAAAAVLLLPADLAERRSDRLAERRAAEWLRSQAAPGGPVAAGRLRVAYYAGRGFVPLPSAPPQGMVRYLQDHGARYVIVDEQKLDEHAGLRDAPGLRPIHREQAAGRSVVVYEVPPPGGPPPEGSPRAGSPRVGSPPGGPPPGGSARGDGHELDERDEPQDVGPGPAAAASGHVEVGRAVPL